MIDITPKRLFKIGAFCFSVAAPMQLLNFIINYEGYNIFSKVSTIMSIIFTFALAFSFVYLIKITPGDMPQSEPEDIDDIIKEFKKNGKA